MATGTITESNLKRLILEETDKTYISRETTTFFDYLFNVDNSIGDTIQKLEEVAIKSIDRKVNLLTEQPKLNLGLSKVPKTTGRLAGLGKQVSSKVSNMAAQSARAAELAALRSDITRRSMPQMGKAIVQRGQGRLAALQAKYPELARTQMRNNAAKARGLVSRVRGGIGRIARTLGRPIRYIAAVIKRAVGGMAKSVSGLGRRAAATRIGSFLVGKFAWLGPVAGPLLGIILWQKKHLNLLIRGVINAVTVLSYQFMQIPMISL